MQGVLRAIIRALAFVSLLTSLFAQWPSYPARGIPKLPNGKPDLSAPAPRTADGKPDLTGVWEIPRGTTPNRGESTRPSSLDSGRLPGAFGNVGRLLKGDLPLRPEAMKLVESRIASFSKDNPDAHCFPIGVMQLNNHPNPRKIVQTLDLVVILYEVNGEVRQIFTDGRALPTADAEPQWSGYSVGKWEGDTLVVETSGFRDEGWLDTDGNPLSSAGKITERFRRLNYGTLEIEITVDDPKSYTKPWTIKVNQSIMLDAQLLDFFCQERDAQHYK